MANFSSCKLNAESIYIWCDLHPVSSLQVKRKQMLRIVLSLNSSESDPGQHSCVRFALYLHAKRWWTVAEVTLWIPSSEYPFPHCFHLRTSVCPILAYDRPASFMKHVHVFFFRARSKPLCSTGNGRVARLEINTYESP